MNIIILNHEYPPAGGGGAVASRHIGLQLSRKHNVEVVTAGNEPSTMMEGGLKVIRLASGRKDIYRGRLLEMLSFMHKAVPFLESKIAGERPDMIMAFFALPAGFIAWMIKRKFNVPYIVLLRGMDVPGFYAGNFSFLNRILSPVIRKVCLAAEAVAANSLSLRQKALRGIPGVKIEVIPNGVDLSDFPSDIAPKTSSGMMKAIFSGRLNRQKDLGCLFQALAQAKKGASRINVILAGDGPQRRYLQGLAKKLGIEKEVDFKGWLDRKTLINQMLEADMYISCSLDEGMPNSVLEAMACGLPVIASDIPPHREIITEGVNGLLFTTSQCDSLCRAIERLEKADSLMQAMSKANLQKIKEYSFGSVIPAMESLLQGKKKDS